MLVLCAAFIGLLVGTGELIARYRDAPFRALGNVAAIAYILLNAAASALAYEFVRALHIVGAPGADDAVNSGLWEVLAGGFGAMAVFRSSLFTVRIGDTDVGVGPAIFLQVLMGATDRACDRSRAAPRSAAIKAIMTGVEFQKAAAALPAFCFGLMQNVSSQEVRDLSSTVAELRRSEMDDLSKTYSLGLALMNIVGERVLRQAVDTLGGQIKGPARASLEVIARIAMVDFGRDAETFAQACVTLSGEEGDALRSHVLGRVTTIASLNLGPQDKVLLLATELLNRFGQGVVSAALVFVARPQAPAVPAPANVVPLQAGGDAGGGTAGQ